MQILSEIYPLLILSIAAASIAWTVTQEEIFREPREYCKHCSENAENIFRQKFFYVFTCEYCFSHWVTLFLLVLSGFRLLIDDWRGYILAFFVISWLANQWMSLYRRLRIEIKHVNVKAKEVEQKLEE